MSGSKSGFKSGRKAKGERESSKGAIGSKRVRKKRSTGTRKSKSASASME